jgi:hypothetical protein
MPTTTKFISTLINTTTTPTVCGTDTSAREVWFSATAAALLVFNAASVAAAHALYGTTPSTPVTGDKVMYLPAGVPVLIVGCQLSTTYIKSVGAASAASCWFYTP